MNAYRIVSTVVLALLFWMTPARAVNAAASKLIPAGASIYIEEMDSDLDGFIRAEFVKQKVALTVVLKREEAHLVMLGTSMGNEKRSWHEGWLTTEKDHATGNVTVVDRATGKMLWAGEAGDRSLWWGGLARGGQRKVATRLIENLKDSIDSKAKPAGPPPPLSSQEIAAMRAPAPDTTSATNLSRPGQPEQRPLNNEEVVKLVEAGLSEDLIIQKIDASEANFRLDTDSMIALKKAGVSDRIIAAMMRRQKG